MDTQKDIQRAGHAEQLLRDEMLMEAFDTVENAITGAWQASPIRDTEGQHELRLMLKALIDVKGYIIEVVNTGKLAKIGSDNAANYSKMQ